MRKFIFTLIIIIPSHLYSQHWNVMGNIDTLQPLDGGYAVLKIINYNNNITIGGGIKKEGNTRLSGVGQWDGTSWQPMGIGFWWGDGASIDSLGAGHCFANYNNRFYCGGTFLGAGGAAINDSSHLSPFITRWVGGDWNPVSPHITYFPGFNSTCTALQAYHNNLYAGGSFGISRDSSGIHSTVGMARWNDTVFSAVGQMAGDFPPDYDLPVLDFCIYQNKLIAGGYFTSINGSAYGAYSGIAAWDDTNWSAFGVGFNNTVFALTVYNGELYAGGMFTATRDNLTPLNHIAKWNGTQWQAVGEGLNDTVLALTVDSVNNILYAGGGFTQTGLGVQAKHLAQWTGTNWQEVGGGTNRTVRALFSKDGNLYVGGTFTRAGNVQASLIACWGYGLQVGVGSQESGVRSQELGVVPNPCASQLGIMNYELGIKEVKIYNVLGEVVKECTMDNAQLIIDISSFAKGIYFVEVKTENKVLRNKFIKQ